MLLLLLASLALGNAMQAVPGEPFAKDSNGKLLTRAGSTNFPNWRDETRDDGTEPRMEVGIGMLMPIGDALGSLGTEGQEKRDALMVASYIINNDPQYNVKLTYNYDTDLLDTSLDDAFAEISQGDSMGAGGTYASPDDYAQRNAQSDLCKNANQLCNNQAIKAIVGGYRSSRSIGMAHCCMSKMGLNQVSPGSTSAYLTRNRPVPGGSQVADRQAAGSYFPYFFRSVPNDDYQGVALKEMAEKYGFTNVGVIFTDDAYSRGMAEAFIAEWTAAGYTVSPRGGINMGYVDHGDITSPGTGKSYAQLAVERQQNEGSSSVTILTTVSHDTDELMKWFGNMGMTGDGWVYLGADGATSTDYSKSHLSDEYLGMAGTTAMMPTETNLYTEFTYAWTQMASSKGGVDGIPSSATKITATPWAGKNNNMVGAFTAQTYDAVAAIAMAATNWLQTMPECGRGVVAGCCTTNPADTTNPSCAALFTREEMRKSLEAGVHFRSLSGQEPCQPQLDSDQSSECLTLFKTADGTSTGQDGARAYSVVNAQGDSWASLGTWSSGRSPAALKLDHDIEWPGGRTTTPLQERPAMDSGSSDDDNDLPGWLIPVVSILIVVVIALACCMFYLIRREKKGQPMFDNSGVDA